jgi:hypothetical protein
MRLEPSEVHYYYEWMCVACPVDCLGAVQGWLVLFVSSLPYGRLSVLLDNTVVRIR